MQRKHRHRFPAHTIRLIPLAMIAVLLAGPVLAALPAILDCEGGCCCCSTPVQTAGIEIRGPRSMNTDCCRPAGSTSCRMSAGDRSASPMAMTRPTANHSGHGAQPLAAGYCSAALSPFAFVAVSRISAGPPIDSNPIYLTTCRLIC